MPQTVKHRDSSHRARKDFDRRKNKKGQGRKGSEGTETHGPKIIGDSIFALTLAPKPGLEVINKTKGKIRSSHRFNDDEDYQQMYHDLLVCVQGAVKLVTGEETKLDPLKEGLDLSVSLTYVINCFESNVLPKGFEYNVDKGQNGYYFTIYKYAPFDDYWHAFEIKSIGQRLWQTNKKLHALFILVIKCFKVSAGILCWWNGGCGYADYMFEEKIEDWENRYEDDDEGTMLDQAIETYLDYEIGEANEYKEAIRNADFIKPEILLKKLSAFDQRDKIVKWMIEVCKFCMLKGNIDDFIYHEQEEDGVEGLQFDQQAAIIWDWDDMFTDEQMECIDSEAQACGVLAPLLNFHFTKETREFDHNAFMTALEWPAELSKLFRATNTLIELIKPKKEKRDAKRSDISIDVNI
jgi:hypothetical protein